MHPNDPLKDAELRYQLATESILNAEWTVEFYQRNPGANLKRGALLDRCEHARIVIERAKTEQKAALAEIRALREMGDKA